MTNLGLRDIPEIAINLYSNLVSYNCTLLRMSLLSRTLRVLGTAGGVLVNVSDAVLARDDKPERNDEDGKRKKACRACTDFKTWTRKYSGIGVGGASTVISRDKGRSGGVESVEGWPRECPIDRIELGQSTWNFLHTMAAYYPVHPSPQQEKEMDAFLRTFSFVFPCEECSEYLREWMADNPPATSSAATLSQWLCRAHNEVNLRLGKPEFNCGDLKQRWKDGWEDGSCN